MIRPRRLLTILRVALAQRLDTLLDAEQLPGVWRWLWRLGPWRLLPAPRRSPGERIRLALEALGPIFIKFGQLLSTRRDLLAPDIADELARLQDQVPPFDSAHAQALIEKALGAPVATLFAAFDPQALASASVAQVHAARLHDGREVVVKVLRPGIEAIIRQDLALLFTLARVVTRYFPDARRLRLPEVVEDYEHTILDELDLQREGANAAALRRNFAGSNLLYVPEIHWDYSRPTVLTMERIDGIPVTDLDALNAQNTDLRLLAERGVEIFFTQVFRDSFFHADMHPGNVFVSREHPRDPQYIAIDCAIMGSLSDADQYYLARNLLAIFQRDYRLVAELHVASGWVPATTSIHAFEGMIRSVCEPIFEKPLGEISFAQLLIRLFQVARRFDMQVQPSLVLLQKTLLNIEGLGRELYPQLDLWSTAQPFLERWLWQRYSPLGVGRRLWRHLPDWLEKLPEIPGLVHARLQVQDTAAEAQARQAQLSAALARARRWNLLLGAVIAALGGAAVAAWLLGAVP